MYWASKIRQAIGLERKAKLPDRFSAREEAEIRRILADNPAVNRDTNILDVLVKNGGIVYFRRGEKLLQEGDQDDHVFFLLVGAVDIHIKSQLGSIRDAPNQIGELAAIKPGSPRSATVIAQTNELAALKVSGPVFHQIYTSYPDFRQRLDVEIATRFRERLAAGHVAKRNISITWSLISLFASAVITALVGGASYFLSWSLETKILATSLLGTLSFIVLLSFNPAYFWRHCFWIVLIAMVGYSAFNRYVILLTSNGWQNLEFVWRIGSEAEISAATHIVQSIPYLVVMIICAFMDYKLGREE